MGSVSKKIPSGIQTVRGGCDTFPILRHVVMRKDKDSTVLR